MKDAFIKAIRDLERRLPTLDAAAKARAEEMIAKLREALDAM